MNMQYKLKIRTLKKDFEIVTAVAALIIATDLAWLVKDIITNGLDVQYGLIGLGLVTGLVIVTKVLVDRMKRDYKKLLKQELEVHVKANKHKKRSK